jgi:hypothetical protein
MPGVQVERSDRAPAYRNRSEPHNPHGRVRLRMCRVWLPVGPGGRAHRSRRPTDPALFLTLSHDQHRTGGLVQERGYDPPDAALSSRTAHGDKHAGV